MRQLLFRAWDGVWIIEGHSFCINADGSNAYLDYTGEWVHNPNLVLMQWTGLTDKKDKKIFEGDIVLVGNAGIGKIVWHQKHCQFKVVWISKTWLTIRGSNWERYNGGEPIFGNHKITFEVIGNIYETPELLKDK